MEEMIECYTFEPKTSERKHVAKGKELLSHLTKERRKARHILLLLSRLSDNWIM